MKLQWLIPGTLLSASLLSSSPADAAKLQSWRFDASQNRLEFSTDSAVQPKAQLIFNPTRLVIDLPGTEFGRPQLRQPVGGAIRTVRIGQFEKGIARIVVELSPGYTIDPNQVKFQGKSPNRWSVQLPSPTRQRASTPPQNGLVVTRNRSNKKVTTLGKQTVIKTAQAGTQVNSLRITGDGFFLRTSGSKPKVKIQRSRDRKAIDVLISDATLSSSLNQNQAVNSYGVSRIEFEQLESKTPSVRMRLRVDRNAPDWRATVSSFGGVIMLPSRRIGTVSSRPSPPRSSSPPIRVSNPKPKPVPVPSPRITPRPLPPKTVSNASLASIKSVKLEDKGKELVIKSDRSLRGITSGWDTQTAMYRVTIPNARLDSSARGISYKPKSSVLRVRLRQLNANTVAVYVLPAAKTRIGRLNIKGDEIALELGGARRITPPIALPPLAQPKPIAGGAIATKPPIRRTTPTPPKSTPKRPSRTGSTRKKVVVMIDPGHGGKDPGAIGIRGLREKDVILPISQRVAKILEQNGYQAVLTRRTDYFVSLKGRVVMAEKANAAVFVSIHANALAKSRPDISGLEVYYYNSGYNLAQKVRRSILRAVKVRDRRVRKARFYVLRKTSMPAILVETGYVTGREDAAKLRQSSYRDKMAEGIARGIMDYLKGR
ncbi:MAG: N-acetylmuramoyl-L-alanine amidase [Cyanobacteria bacterium P01_A01_bin.45]